MRKTLVFGIALAFVGVIVALASNFVIEKYEEPSITVAALPFPDYLEVSGVFYQNDLLLLFFPVPNPTGSVPDSDIRIPVEIVDPSGHTAEFEAVLKQQQQQIGLYQIKIIQNKASLIVDENQFFIGGVVSKSGEYKGRLNVNPQMIPYYWTGPSKELIFYKQRMKREYPYRSVLPIGISLIVAGVPLALWGGLMKDSKRKSRLKR